MSDFLFYPQLQFNSRKDVTDVTTAWFPLVDKGYDNCDINSFGDDEHIKFAIIDDSDATYQNLVCKVSFFNGEELLEVAGKERIADARKIIADKFSSYKEEKYPSGLHWVDDSFYLGNMRIAYIVQKDGLHRISVSEMHKSKFFVDTLKSGNSDLVQELLNGNSCFKDDFIEKAKKLINITVDIERFEANRKAKEEAKKAEQAANNQFLGLPELTGTDKQIKWANDLRMSFIKSVGIEAIQAKKWKKAAEKAKFWIDNRNTSIQELSKLSFLK